MPIPQHMKYNAAATYRLGAVFEYTKEERAKIAAALKSQKVYVSDKDSFIAPRFDLTQSYVLPYISNNAVVDAWHSNPMQFWQNQLQFALWCATAGCGVSVRDHILPSDEKTVILPPLGRSVFQFHVYYQTRAILAELGCPLPTHEHWNAFDNTIDRFAFQKICGEFGVDPNQAAATCHLSVKHTSSGGLGRVYNYATNLGYICAANDFDASTMSFSIPNTTNNTLKVDYIAQEGVENGFAWCMLDRSVGFTREGVVRINESIRAYAWGILGAQDQTRTSILGVGRAFDAQKQFAANVEPKIYVADNSPASIKAYQEVVQYNKSKLGEGDLSTSIEQYQTVLPYAKSKLDYVLGGGLYMVPSDMNLRIGTYEGYNNEIQVADDDAMNLGTNHNVNDTHLPPMSSVGLKKVSPPVDPPTHIVIAPPPTADSAHEKTKIAITLAAIGAVFAFYLYK